MTHGRRRKMLVSNQRNAYRNAGTWTLPHHWIRFNLGNCAAAHRHIRDSPMVSVSDDAASSPSGSWTGAINWLCPSSASVSELEHHDGILDSHRHSEEPKPLACPSEDDLGTLLKLRLSSGTLQLASQRLPLPNLTPTHRARPPGRVRLAPNRCPMTKATVSDADAADVTQGLCSVSVKDANLQPARPRQCHCPPDWRRRLHHRIGDVMLDVSAMREAQTGSH